MTKKLQSFFVLKLNSGRLKEYKYNIRLSLTDARKNGEIIRMGNSQFFEVIRNVTGRSFNQEELTFLESEEKKIKRKPSSEENKLALLSLREQIDRILFVPEVISLKVDNKKHYEYVIKNGLSVNNKKYVRIMSGAGNLRRNTVLLIDNTIFEEVNNILDNGRNKNVELNPGKFVAYQGLYNSSGHRVSFPNFTVVPDLEYTRMAKLNWINSDDVVQESQQEILLNCFDGQGLISPSQAQRWANEIGLDYIPSTMIIRAPYAKGQVVTFDFHKYCSVTGKHITEDIWGNDVDIRFVDLILSKSQFKLASSYNSLPEYIGHCYKNGLGFYLSRASYNNPKNYVWSNYMFLQVLDLSDEDIKNLCADTLEHFSSLISGDYRKMILYLGGDTFSHEYKEDWFDRIDNVTKALIINPELKNDPYVYDYFVNSLNRKIRDSYMGKLLFEGNFSPLVADPYMQCEAMFTDEPRTLLSNDGHYYKFWKDRNVDMVASCRSPLTHHSEMNVSKMESSKEMAEWYKYQDTSFIYNPKGLDTLYMAD